MIILTNDSQVIRIRTWREPILSLTYFNNIIYNKIHRRYSERTIKNYNIY